MSKRALVFGTVSAARTFNGRISTRLGYPKPGVNALDGSLSLPQRSGWIVSHFFPIRVTDTNGVYGPAGTVYFLLGPITPAMEARIMQMTNPPTIVDVPDGLFRRGRRFVPRIASWSNGQPVLDESTEDFDEGIP